MGMDLTLAKPVPTGETSTLHSGSCTDSEFGCIACWNAENNHEGRIFKCDRCKTETTTRVTQAYDEPVLYALCEKCRIEQEKAAEEEYRQMMRDVQPDDFEYGQYKADWCDGCGWEKDDCCCREQQELHDALDG